MKKIIATAVGAIFLFSVVSVVAVEKEDTVTSEPSFNRGPVRTIEVLPPSDEGLPPSDEGMPPSDEGPPPPGTEEPSGRSHPIVKAIPIPTTVNSLLESCPDIRERRQIRGEINFGFDREPEPWACTDGGNESSAMLSAYNVFRLMKLIKFDEPMPIIGQDIYEWFKSQNLLVVFFLGDSDDNSHASGNTIYINAYPLADPAFRSWSGGLSIILGTILHEARHTDRGGGKSHNCGNSKKDSSLGYGGAWAVHYYYWLGLAQHSGNTLTPEQKAEAADIADLILGINFCH